MKTLKITRGSKLFALTLCLLILNATLVGPFVFEKWGGQVGNLTFVVLRVTLLLGFAVLFSSGPKPKAQKRWMETFRAVTLLAFLDQVVLKGALLAIDQAKHPEAWAGSSVSAVAVPLMMGFLLFLPFLIVTAFFGYELGRRLSYK